ADAAPAARRDRPALRRGGLPARRLGGPPPRPAAPGARLRPARVDMARGRARGPARRRRRTAAGMVALAALLRRLRSPDRPRLREHDRARAARTRRADRSRGPLPRLGLPRRPPARADRALRRAGVAPLVGRRRPRRPPRRAPVDARAGPADADRPHAAAA